MGSKILMDMCKVNSDGCCKIQEKLVFHAWHNSKHSNDNAKFTVTNIINGISKYKSTYDEVETTLVVYNPAATNVYSLAPFSQSSESSNEPSSSSNSAQSSALSSRLSSETSNIPYVSPNN